MTLLKRAFIARTNLGLLISHGSLAVGVSIVFSIISLFYTRQTDSVPRSTLAVAIPLSNDIRPLHRRGTMSPEPGGRRETRALGSTQRFQAVRGDMNGQFMLELAPCEPLVQRSPDAAAEGSAVDLSTAASSTCLRDYGYDWRLAMFGGMVLSSVVVLASTRRGYAPEDDPVVTAVVL
ncbi:hypothetical protein CTA1_9434 [Colletotrichum tanaceti]|uniref:Uncharacterized protein n=1 Tax=Colletotrichum tanaceti TaxID=1306861 RepID=A0A4U6XH45_9PEZI|nr:hypothetical protein CTA1_9434 [Colletotrichum tanaceti]